MIHLYYLNIAMFIYFTDHTQKTPSNWVLDKDKFRSGKSDTGESERNSFFQFLRHQIVSL